jgi:two-component system cell cycle sensor histidine kinase/response regulator CckA
VSKALRILLVEDSATDAKLVMAEIRHAGHEVEFARVEDAEAFRAALRGSTWDAIICDWSMPKFSARAALAVVKDRGLDLPFIIVSGTVGEEMAVEAMRAGASDYVIKDKLTRLVPVIEREVRDRRGRAAHRQSEKARVASETRFSRLAQSGIIGIAIGDFSGNIVECNAAFARIVGMTPDAVMAGAVRWHDLAAPPSLPSPLSAHVAGRRTHEITPEVATPYEKVFRRQDGSHVAVLIGMGMLDESSAIAFMIDLSAQKRAEDALRRSEEQLRQAQKMDAIGRLAGGVAHDFNNVLSVILSYSALLMADLPPGHPMREDLEEIDKAGRRAAGLTRQLLMFSRQEVVEPVVVDLNDVLTNMEKMLQRILGEDVDLKLDRGSAVQRICVDPSHIEQVIMNLVVNSRDAMPTGGKLTIETRSVVLDEAHAREHLGLNAGRYVMLAVSDTGMGMDRATQAHIFEPFFTTKDKGKGTGLGLSTVFGIVRQCGGGIWVYSELEHGTTFKVYLPCVDAEVVVKARSRPPVILTGSETILLVEDEDQIRIVAREILCKQGYHVIEARDAGEAIRQCESYIGVIDLLLTDVVMPLVSGPELAKRLVRTRPGVKVLCMSGYTNDTVVRHGAMEAGIAYLQKPITPDILARKVRAILDSP